MRKESQGDKESLRKGMREKGQKVKSVVKKNESKESLRKGNMRLKNHNKIN